MKRQKYISKKWFILLAIILLLIPITVYAQGGIEAPTGLFNEVLENMVGFLSQVLALMQKILWPIFLAIGGLMNNDLLFGAGMEERLLDIWVQIRNLVNIAFVVILLGIALYNVTGIPKEGDYQLKVFLPKFVIALILVNFTFIGLKFVLDVSNVITHVVFTLPSSISSELQNTQVYMPDDPSNLSNDERQKIEQNIDRVCRAMFGHPDKHELRVVNVGPEKAQQYYCQLQGKDNNRKYVLTDNGKSFFQQFTSRNSALILAVQMMKVVDIDKLSDALRGQNPDISGLTFNLLFSVIMYLVYAVAYVVLFVVLLARLVFLWIIIALSPIIAVKIVFSKLPTGDKDYFNLFIVNAFIPALIGIPLTIGYIMLGALQEAQNPITNDFNWSEAFSLETSGVSDLQTMVIAFGAVAVVWMGVFAAAERSIASSVVQSIKSRVSGAGRALARATRFLPIIPAAAGPKGRTSFQQVRNLFTAPLRRLEQKYGGGFEKRVSIPNIEALRRRGRAGTPRELKQYLAQGITQRKFQQPLARVIKGWREGTAEQKRTREQIAKQLGGPGALERYERTGQLSRAQARKLQQWAQGTLPTALGTPRTRSGAGGAGAGAGAGAETAAQSEQKQDIVQAKQVGYIDENSEAYRTAERGGDELKTYANNNKRKMKVYAAIGESSDQLKAAQTQAGNIESMDVNNITQDNVKDAADQLEKQLTAARNKLESKGIDKAEIKTILQRAVNKHLKTEAKRNKFYGTDAGKKVQSVING
jgi:hypothetical protein